MKPTFRYILAALVILAAATGAWAEQGISSPEQRKQLKSLALETRSSVERARGGLKRAHRDLFRAYGNYNLDERAAKAATEKASKAQIELLNINLDKQLGMRRILNSDQFADLWDRIDRKASKGRVPFLGPPDDLLWDWISGPEIGGLLGLTPDQAKRLKQPALDQQRKKVVEKLRRDSRQLIELYSNYDLDASAARKLIDSIHSSQRDLADLNHKLQQNLRSVLSDSQFGKLMDEVAKRMPRHGPRHHP